ncbi:transposase [Streptomyces sp. V2I9]|nr:transposase [Streptomyces sp. V2I9]
MGHGVVIRRHELSDAEGELLPALIPGAGRGRPRAEARTVVNGMVCKIRTGASWRGLPERYRTWKTVCTRLRRYPLHGVFTRAPQQVRAGADAAGGIDRLVQLDSTIARAHRHAAATGREGGAPARRPDDHPSAGPQEPNSTSRPTAPADHWPSPSPQAKAYSSRGFRAYLCRRGVPHTIPEKRDQRKHRRNHGRRGGRPPGFDRGTYRRRNTVERCFNRLKAFHGSAAGYDETAPPYEAAVSLASLLLGARSLRRRTLGAAHSLGSGPACPLSGLSTRHGGPSSSRSSFTVRWARARVRAGDRPCSAPPPVGRALRDAPRHRRAVVASGSPVPFA